MNSKGVLIELIDKKKLAILKVLLDEKGKQFYLREIATKSGVPLATAHRNIKKLVSLSLVSVFNIKKIKLYSICENEAVSFLEYIIRESAGAMQTFVDNIRSIGGVQSIISYGKESNDKANILIIGENVDVGKVKEVCFSIKEKYNFTITHLILTKEQYNQMSDMGLYPQQRKVLWVKE